MLKRFEGRWDRIEELVIYVALALAFLAQILPNVIPAARQFLDGGGANAVIVDRQRMWDTFGAEIKRDYL